MEFLVNKGADISSKDNAGVSKTDCIMIVSYSVVPLVLNFELAAFPGTQEMVLHSPFVHKPNGI